MTLEGENTAFLVVGRDVDGGWTVRESGGSLLGRFVSGSEALRFAERERQSNPRLMVASSKGMHPRIRGRLSLADHDGRKRGSVE